VFECHYPNVRTTKEVYSENGKQFTRTHYETREGTLTAVHEHAGFTNWAHEKLFKSPDDYKAILAYIRDAVYRPCYDAAARAEKDLGEDVILRAGISLEPLQDLISGHYMKMETFCVEWMDNRDEILKLYDALVENCRRIYPLVADSPLSHANYGGNVVPQIVGPDVFREYYLPNYEEAAQVLHKRQKLIGVHFDDNCRLLSDSIGGTSLDYIEAFTPDPDTDMTLGEAREAWPDKVLWLNFPSSVHLRSNAGVEQFTVDLLDQVERTDGIIMGITEDMPPDRWRDSCRSIMNGLERHALGS